MKPNPTIPIFITTLDLELPTRHLYDDIVRQHKTTDYYRVGNNFPITGHDMVMKSLYSAFVLKAKKILGPFNFTERNIETCWAYVSNKEHHLKGIHNHVNTSTVNGIYYLNVPKSNDERDGIISFFDDDNKELFWYKPRNGDMIIIPNYLKHEPQYISTDEYRIAINMEIFCDYVW